MKTKDVLAKDMEVGYVWDDKTVIQIVKDAKKVAIEWHNNFMRFYDNDDKPFKGVQITEEDFLIKTDFETVDSIRCAETIIEIIHKHNALVDSLKEMK